MKYLFLLVLLISCYTYKDFELKQNEYIGLTEFELIKKNGNPTFIYEVSGIKSLEYKKNFTPTCTSNDYNFKSIKGLKMKNENCTPNEYIIQYIIENGKVINWTYKGNYCNSWINIM